LHRQFAHLGAAQNAVDVGRAVAMQKYRIRAVGYQAVVRHRRKTGIDRRHAILGGSSDCAWSNGGAGEGEQTTVAGGRYRRNGGLDLGSIAYAGSRDLERKTFARHLSGLHIK